MEQFANNIFQHVLISEGQFKKQNRLQVCKCDQMTFYCLTGIYMYVYMPTTQAA